MIGLQFTLPVFLKNIYTYIPSNDDNSENYVIHKYITNCALLNGTFHNNLKFKLKIWFPGELNEQYYVYHTQYQTNITINEKNNLSNTNNIYTAKIGCIAKLNVYNNNNILKKVDIH